jgi:hypothetical protein
MHQMIWRSANKLGIATHVAITTLARGLNPVRTPA